jgi:hypothetical protein
MAASDSAGEALDLFQVSEAEVAEEPLAARKAFQPSVGVGTTE